MVTIATRLGDIRTRSDIEVVTTLDELAQTDRQTGAEIVAHLVIVKERGIHLDMGFSSLVDYSVERLRCSKDVAYKRSAAVKVATEHPEVVDWLADGTMTLSGLAVLAPHAGDGPLVARARGKSKRQIQTLAASEHPDRNWNRVQFRVRPVDEDLSTRGQSRQSPRRPRRTVPNELLDQIGEALDLDSHSHPGREVVALLGRALETYVSRRKKERFHVTDRPRPAPEQPTRNVPAAHVREAYENSGGRCEYVSSEGKRCTATAFLEVDHVIPRAQGGDHAQTRILCDAHNQRMADIALGEGRMDAARRRARMARDVKSALTQLGFSAKVAAPAAEAAVDELGPDAELERLIRAALARAGARSGSGCREPGPAWIPTPGSATRAISWRGAGHATESRGPSRPILRSSDQTKPFV